VTTCEADLMRHAACGDQGAFRQLWKAHHDIAQAAALRLCHQCAWAEEITQGALLLAWHGRPRFQQGPPVSPLADAHPLSPRAQWDGKARDISAAAFPGGAQPDTRRRRWGEPSLVERIERVCGTAVEARENRLTLVG
jgi:hypothetical protein